jgi:hypothetical protein
MIAAPTAARRQFDRARPPRVDIMTIDNADHFQQKIADTHADRCHELELPRVLDFAVEGRPRFEVDGAVSG